jgi:hypothetical protein
MKDANKEIILKQFSEYEVLFKGESVIIERRKDGKPLNANDLLFNTLKCEQSYE